MSDAQPHTMLSSSPAPTDVRQTFAGCRWKQRCCPGRSLNTVSSFFRQATATEDVAESLSPDDGEFSRLDLDFPRLTLNVNFGLIFLVDPDDRLHSGGDILQDCSSEHSSLTKTESDPPGDLSLPGEEPSPRSRRSMKLPRRTRPNV